MLDSKTMTPIFWHQAIHDLNETDPVMRRIIQHYDDCVLKSRGDAFATLARSIVGQQISVKAAESVWQKVILFLPDIEPSTLHAADEAQLRQCGLSLRKISYLKDLAYHFIENRLNTAEWHDMDDEALIRQLIQVKGIGRWTAEMFLIFHMLRPDILPLDDIGLQRAVSVHYFANKSVNKKEIEQLALQWKPWRSVATWYLWRSLDPLPVEY